MKRLNNDILIGILVASLFWVGVFVWQSSQRPHHKSAESQSCEGTKSECAKATSDERIADYTWWLAVLTAALVTVSAGQGYFLLRSDKTARIAANAADRSARAAIALQLPIIRARHPASLGHSQSTANGVTREDCRIHFVEFWNHGSTKALPVEVHYGVIVGNKPLPKLPLYDGTVLFEVNETYEPNTRVPYRVYLGPECRRELTGGQWSEICGGGLRVTFYCLLAYLDFMDTRREAGFCWRWDKIGLGMGWVPDGTPAYNRKT